jgi:hypothetical protein
LHFVFSILGKCDSHERLNATLRQNLADIGLPFDFLCPDVFDDRFDFPQGSGC